MSFTPRESGVFKVAATQVAGATPRNGKINPLLLRDDVGKARVSTYDLPDDHFSYGRPGNQDLEGAREVSMRWVVHTPSRGPEESAPDFVRFNKKAATSKVTTAKDLKQFRQTQDMNPNTPRDSAPQSARLPMKHIVPSDVVPGFTYGRATRLSTPIHDVVSNRFADKAEKDLSRFYEEFHRVQEIGQNQVRKIPLTTASRGHGAAGKKALGQQEDEKELFKLDKFKRIPAKVQTSHRKKADDFGENDTGLDYAGSANYSSPIPASQQDAGL